MENIMYYVNGAVKKIKAKVKPNAPIQLQEYRRNFCNPCHMRTEDKCDINKIDLATGRRGCGCTIMDKIALKEEYCPLEKWQEVP